MMIYYQLLAVITPMINTGKTVILILTISTKYIAVLKLLTVFVDTSIMSLVPVRSS